MRQAGLWLPLSRSRPSIRLTLTIFFLLSPRDHRSFSGATLTCPGPSFCRGSQLPNGSHHLHPWNKHLLPWQALHHLTHLSWYYSFQTSLFNIFHWYVYLFILIFNFFPLCVLFSWVVTHGQNARHTLIFRTRQRAWTWQGEGAGAWTGPGKRAREGAWTGSGQRERPRARQRKRERAWQREGWVCRKCGARPHLATR